VALLLVAAFGISFVYTVSTTLMHEAPADFDATTPTVLAGYVLGGMTTVLSFSEQRWARWAVTVVLVSLLAAAVLVYPHYFTAEHQDTFGWFENDAYVAFLALALREHLLRPWVHV
jgi:peptidoglycan/LPS O-acetylase OafA/YrhL